MCGILGSIPATANREHFLQALNTLSHRGPDDFGVCIIAMRSASGIGVWRSSIQARLDINRCLIMGGGAIYYCL